MVYEERKSSKNMGSSGTEIGMKKVKGNGEFV
jgi:hypothetical protein